jgi:hypothetical protein
MDSSKRNSSNRLREPSREKLDFASYNFFALEGVEEVERFGVGWGLRMLTVKLLLSKMNPFLRLSFKDWRRVSGSARSKLLFLLETVYSLWRGS